MTPFEYPEEIEGAVLFDGHENAIIGWGHIFGQDPVVVYDVERILANLEALEMTPDEAQEFFEFNIAGAYVGPRTPFLMYPWTPNLSQAGDTISATDK